MAALELRRISDRSITVTGEATVSAEPDEYLFLPTYEFRGNDETALAELTDKSQAVTDRLKELGVADNQIKTNADNYRDFWLRRPEGGNDEATRHRLSLEITVADKALAQTVQDYLLTTNPIGSITPQLTFSDNKRRELEGQARDEATKDARAKAEQTASNLGFKLGSVKEVNDGSGFGIMPFRGVGLDSAAPTAAEDLSLTLQPGENDIHYTVTVVYFVR